MTIVFDQTKHNDLLLLETKQKRKVNILSTLPMHFTQFF